MDLTEMAALEFAEPMGSQWTAKQLEDDLTKQTAVVLVLEIDARIVGHAVAWCVLDALEIMTLAVSPLIRRQGLGQQLLHALLQARPHQSAFLELRESNRAALALYEQAGFERVGRRKRYYRNGEDALIMRRENPTKQSPTKQSPTKQSGNR
jgi:ribosomal-protein-alanine N-acetyltransferase